MKLIDFTSSVLSDRNLQYGGRAGEKKGIIYNNERYILKFPKNKNNLERSVNISYTTSPLNEYIGSNIYKILGYDVQETILGVFYDGKRNKVVCACKDFIIDDKEILVPYTSIRNDSSLIDKKEDIISLPCNINEIIFQLDNNTVLSTIENVKGRFFDCLLIDMLINNNDRNEDNWGLIYNKKTTKYKLAPIYDCGACFYGKSDEDKIRSILKDDIKLESSSLNCMTSYFDDNRNRISIKNIFKINNTQFSKSINNVYKKVTDSLDTIKDFIYSIPEKYDDILIMSTERKEYYIKTFEIRLNKLLKEYAE